MIESIFENLFPPNSPEEIERRKPLKKFKDGDIVWLVRDAGMGYTFEIEGEKLKLSSAEWDIVAGEYVYVAKSLKTGVTDVVWEDDLESL